MLELRSILASSGERPLAHLQHLLFCEALVADVKESAWPSCPEELEEEWLPSAHWRRPLATITITINRTRCVINFVKAPSGRTTTAVCAHVHEKLWSNRNCAHMQNRKASTTLHACITGALSGELSGSDTSQCANSMCSPTVEARCLTIGAQFGA